MKKLLLILLVCINVNAFAQVFSYQGSLPALIPDNNTTVDFAVPVTGLPAQINSSYGLMQVCISITHPWVSDLKISLTSPDGNTIILSLHNGGSGQNYSATCFRMDAATNVGSANAPFQGNFLPDQSVNYLNNNQNPNGIWNLSVIDVFPTSAGSLNSAAIQFSNNPPPDPTSTLLCTTTNATGCVCKNPTLNDCDLVPDLVVSHHIIRDTWMESPGHVELSNAVIDIGSGPLEIKPTAQCYCDTLPVPCTTTSCPDGSPPKERVNQRIYHKNANGMMTYNDTPAGNQSFHPTHGHVHAEEFCEFSLRVATGNPDPTTWPYVGTCLKQGYCLINMGDCNSVDSICMSNGTVITNSMLPNLDMGTVTGCGPMGQGIFVGNYDIYSSGFGQVINVPNICNGLYYIVAIIDPFNHFIEEDETNNWAAVPVMLTQQPGTALNASFTYQQQGMSVAFFNFTVGVTRTWDFGDGTVVTAPYPVHLYTAPGTYNVQLTVFNGTCASTSVQQVIVIPTGISSNQSGIFDLNVFPNPAHKNFTVEYQLVNQSEIKIDVLNVLGEKVIQIANEIKLSGKHHLNLDNLDAGTYFIRLTANDQVLTKRVVKL
ncbi:MAG: T9SS type A sorting domain-containing protein [Bacteroidia bacterium]